MCMCGNKYTQLKKTITLFLFQEDKEKHPFWGFTNYSKILRKRNQTNTWFETVKSKYTHIQCKYNAFMSVYNIICHWIAALVSHHIETCRFTLSRLSFSFDNEHDMIYVKKICIGYN